MQDAQLTELHSSLASAEAARGAHGGLGFSGGKKGSKEKKTKAEKSLMQSATSSGREYATTTAAAVAAGHWDPFARPVAFKMKEVNRRVGGLYTMFVKGKTEGGTLKEDAPAPVEGDQVLALHGRWTSGLAGNLAEGAAVGGRCTVSLIVDGQHVLFAG